MSSVDDVVAKFQARFYPGCDATTAASLFSDAWKWAVVKFRLRESTVVISLTEGVREYDLDGTVNAVREAYYQQASNASSWLSVQGVSIDRLARVEDGWRANDGESIPWRYYLKFDEDSASGKRIIGFDPMPQETTSLGYPNVTLYVVSGSDLSDSDDLPSFLLTDDWFLYWMAERWAIAQDPQKAGYWMQLRKEEEGDVSNFLRSGVDEVPAQMFIAPFVNRKGTAI